MFEKTVYLPIRLKTAAPRAKIAVSVPKIAMPDRKTLRP